MVPRAEADQESREVFGYNVALARTASSMTQEELAEAVDIHLRHIKAIESGTRGPSFALIFRLADALGAKPAALFKHRNKVPKRKRGRPKKKR